MMNKKFYKDWQLPLLLLLAAVIFISCDKSSGVDGNVHKDKDSTVDVPKKPLYDRPLIIPGAYFNDPDKIKKKQPGAEIIDKLIECINSTPSGEDIYVNIYEFDYLPVSLALESAYRRGVLLNIMVDSSKKSSRTGNKETIDRLNNIIQPPSKLVTINNKSWPNAINHHKYVLFSRINIQGKKYNDVVFSTSQNFDAHQLTVLQDALILNNEELYDAFVANWNAMENLATEGMKNFEFEVFHSTDGDISAYFYPKRINGNWDGKYLAEEILDQLNDYSHDTIQLGMGRWSDGQIGIADKLIELQNKGTQVEVVTRYEGGDGLGIALTKKLKNLEKAGGNVLFLPKPYVIHSKYMLIKGVWEGARHQVIIAGSLNYSNPSTQHNNNLVLVLKDSPLFKDYEDNFRYIQEVFKK